MKKILFSLTFIAAMLTSCMRDSGLDYEGRGSVDVTVGVSAPELAATRAAMTGMNSGLGAIDNFTDVEWANYDLRYIFEVYDVTPGFEDFDTPVKQRMIQTYDSYQETSFQLRLIPNRQYKFVVWADIVEQGSEDDFRYDTSDLKCITRIGDVKPMDETMDAYFVQQNITIKDSAPQSLVLTRPFGKMRVISTDIDELNVGSVPYEVYVTFYNHPIFQSLNALTGNAENEVADVSYHYTVSKDAPYTLGYDYSPANQTIFADYIFAQSQVYGDQEVNFSIQVNEAGGREICHHTLDTQIPLGRNKLTTIIGNLFTTSTEFMISIDDDFSGEYIVDNIWNGEFAELPAPGADGWIEIDNPSQLATLLSGDCDGMNVRLVEDMNFDGLVIPSYSSTATGNNNSFVFDGNGHIISNFKTAGGVSAGLFSDLVKATVRNLTIQQALVAPDAATRAAGDFYAGALVGRTYGNCVFENVHVINSVVNGVNKVGGLIGNVAENS
ncbi:MAG: hypothetical protein J6U69_05190, partial [Alistipes sp.]|nr:hypothetical protein [Alistipes sp.]